jgi:hypothetical protein
VEKHQKQQQYQNRNECGNADTTAVFHGGSSIDAKHDTACMDYDTGNPHTIVGTGRGQAPVRATHAL